MSDQNQIALVPRGPSELLPRSSIDSLLDQIRPQWKDKNLVGRVRRLLPADPSSACQRMLNAAIHDLREKIVTAGLDLAKEAAELYKLSSITKVEDILDSYSPTSTLELAYRMGILSRPDWKRLRRAYDIRRDLEHEDDEYEAQAEDFIYIFKTSIEIVLSKEPREILRVSDVKELIESPSHVKPSDDFLQDFEQAPDSRQIKILSYLVMTCLDGSAADVVRQNAIDVLRSFQPLTRNTVKIELSNLIQERAKRRPFSIAEIKVAAASGTLPYLKQRQLSGFFDEFHKKMSAIGFEWTQYPHHESLFNELEDIGGLVFCPPAPRKEIVRWMILCYLGQPGGYGTYGRNRKVFYSNVAAPRIEEMFRAAGKLIHADVEDARKDKLVTAAMKDVHVARRFEELVDIVGLSSQPA